MLYKSALLTQASGSLGGMTASHNPGGLYLRARTIPTDPNTAPQQVMKAALGDMVNRWINTLTAAQRDGWNSYAAAVPLTNPLGDPVFVSGMNHYVRSNTPRVQAGVTVVDAAPSVFDTGNLGVVGVTNATVAGAAFDVTFDNAQDWATIVGGHLLIYQGRPKNATINFFKGPFQFAGKVDGAAIPPVSPSTITSLFTLILNLRMWVKIRASLADGRLTQSVIIGPETIVA